MNTTYDLVIIGGGPAGVSAGIYAARKRLKTAVITPDIGGQSMVSDCIENWIGTPKISGADLAKALRDHLLTYTTPSQTVELHEPEFCTNISKAGDLFTVTTDSSTYTTKTVLITTGSHRRKLDVPGAKEFDNKGISYCASCDGPLFSGQNVVVVGGGNAAFESASQLLAYCKSVTLLNRTESFKADELTIDRLSKNPQFKIITNAVVTEVHGNGFVTGISYQNTQTKEVVKIETPAIFVEIGLLPSTDFAKDVVELNRYSQIITDPKTQRTNALGVWAAGDCTDALYHQNNIASGDAVKALEDIYLHIHTR